MKIGVITFFDNGNYGSELQSLAMNGFCKVRGHDVTFLRIYSSNRLARLVNRLYNRFMVWGNCKIDKEYKKVHHDLHSNAIHQLNISEELRSHIHAKVNSMIRTGNISAFRMRHLSPFDCYICGSDQVWSALIQPVRTCNFLRGISSNRKIAYAPSIGVNDVPNYYIRTVAPLIRDFKYLSVREKNVANLFEKKIGVRPLVVVDPTILVGVEYWNNILHEQNLSKPERPYIFCYFLGELSEAQTVFLNDFAGNKEIIILPYEQHADRLKNGKYVKVDHLEFANYIKHADYVFTDSFHATVFSLLFHREFAVFQRSHFGVTKQTSRIESLLSLVGLKERLVCNSKVVYTFKTIKYDNIDRIIETERQKSVEFLDNALTQVQKNLK